MPTSLQRFFCGYMIMASFLVKNRRQDRMYEGTAISLPLERKILLPLRLASALLPVGIPSYVSNVTISISKPTSEISSPVSFHRFITIERTSTVVMEGKTDNHRTNARYEAGSSGLKMRVSRLHN